MIDGLVESVNSNESNRWKRLPELHISLSRTFPVRFHHIDSIRTSLQQELSQSMVKYVSPSASPINALSQPPSRFSSRLEHVTILTNENGSTCVLLVLTSVYSIDRAASHRSFLVFNLDQHRQFSKLIDIVDKVLHEYRYPSYYEVQPAPQLTSVMSQPDLTRIPVFTSASPTRQRRIETKSYQRTGKTHVR